MSEPVADEGGERRIDYQTKPWRREVAAGVALTLVIAVGGWIKVGGVSTDAQQASDAAQRAVASVQANREEVVRQQCEDQNARNAATIGKLRILARQAIAAHPEREQGIRASTASSVALIDALVPVHNCDARVQAVAVK